MVPFRLKPPQFRDRYARALAALAPAAIGVLRQQLARPLQSGVSRIEVQLHLEPDDEPPLAAWIHYQGPHNKVDAADPTLHAGRSMALAIDFAAMEAFDERFYRDEAFGGLDIAADVFKAWFAECWWKAGGWACPVPAELAVHDGLGDGRAVPLAPGAATAEPPAAAFETMVLPPEPTVSAPDGSDVRVLLGRPRGGMAHFRLEAGRCALAVVHRTVEEIWYVVEGAGELWRCSADGQESVVALRPGLCATIPLGTRFQFRAAADRAVAVVAVTMPPWPGPDEAVGVTGPWPAA